MFKAYWKPIAASFVAGSFGVLVTLASYQLWQDHKALGQVITFLNQNIQQQQQQHGGK